MNQSVFSHSADETVISVTYLGLRPVFILLGAFCMVLTLIHHRHAFISIEVEPSHVRD